MEQYQWKLDEEGNRIYDYSEEELHRRKCFLDKVNGYAMLTYKDIESNIKPGKNILAMGPGSGKTTALRQFVCRPSVFAEGVLIATHRIDYVEELAYDICATIGYKYRNDIIALHSKSESSKLLKENIDYLKDYKIVVTTHKRLLLDNSKVLLSVSDKFNPLGEQSGRKYVFIDEDPQYLARINIDQSGIGVLLTYITRESKIFGVEPSQMDYRIVVKRIVDDLLIDKSIFKYQIQQFKGICGSVTYKDLSSPNNLRANRFIHKLSIVTKELIGRLERSSKTLDDTIYYHIGMLGSPYLTILDGTGDIINSTSEIWNVSIRTPRNLHIQDIGRLPNTNLPRRPDSSDVDYSPFYKAIIEKAKIHNKVLVVCWKDLKPDEDSYYKEYEYVSHDQDIEDSPVVEVRVHDKYLKLTDSFDEYLKSNLPKDLVDKVEFITYMSGQERVTSRYSDCDCIMFLGKFFLPNAEVNRLNSLKLANQTSRDYTSSLLVQSIYRTTARHNKPISIYFSSDWSKDYILEVMGKFDEVADNNKKLAHFYYKYLLDTKLANSRTKKYYELIMKHFDELVFSGEYIYEVPEEFNTKTCKRCISNICNKLNWLNYENIELTRKFKLSIIDK